VPLGQALKGLADSVAPSRSRDGANLGPGEVAFVQRTTKVKVDRLKKMYPNWKGPRGSKEKQITT